MPITLYALLTWTTRDRAPIIDAAGAAFLHTFLPKAADLRHARALGMSVVRNHVHLLLHLDGVVDIPQLVQRLKGASARIANRDRVLGEVRLRWAKGYDLRSVSPRALPAAQADLARQGVKHPGLAMPTASDGTDPSTPGLIQFPILRLKGEGSPGLRARARPRNGVLKDAAVGGVTLQGLVAWPSPHFSAGLPTPSIDS